MKSWKARYKYSFIGWYWSSEWCELEWHGNDVIRLIVQRIMINFSLNAEELYSLCCQTLLGVLLNRQNKWKGGFLIDHAKATWLLLNPHIRHEWISRAAGGPDQWLAFTSCRWLGWIDWNLGIDCFCVMDARLMDGFCVFACAGAVNCVPSREG